MSINVSKERLLSPREAAKHRAFVRDGKPVNLGTLYRYIQRGTKGIRLETIATPRGRMTSDEAIVRFIERLSMPALSPAAPTPSQTRRTDPTRKREG